MSKNSKKEDQSSAQSPLSDSEGGQGHDTLSRQSNFSSYADYTSRDVSEDIEDDEPQLSERVATYRDDDVNLNRITFSIENLIKHFFYKIGKRAKSAI